MIFVNLAVADVAKSRLFYQALGYSINEAFSNADGACVVLSEAIYVMVLQRDKFQSFTNRPVGQPAQSSSALYALLCADREAVDAMASQALAAGGTQLSEARDLGFMYSRMFADLDGHVFEPFWMDPKAANG